MATGGNRGYKNPPVFSENKDYESWKTELNMWMLVTDLEKAKQAPAVVLSLPDGPLRSSALTLPTADLHADEGMRKLLEHLDNELLKDLKDRAYVAYSNFEKFTRTPAMSMFDYIQMFELKQKLAEKFDMKLPDSILAYKLLDNSGLSETDRVMVKTAVQELKYDAVKSAMRRIFGEGLKETPIVKEEPVFAAELQRTSFYGRRNNLPKRQVNGTNPKNKEGRITTCRKCGSRFHWEKIVPKLFQKLTRLLLALMFLQFGKKLLLAAVSILEFWILLAPRLCAVLTGWTDMSPICHCLWNRR